MCMVMQMGEFKKIIDVSLGEEVKKLLKFNSDLKVTPELKEKIYSFPNDELIKVTKEIGSLKITDAELVTEELLQKEL